MAHNTDDQLNVGVVDTPVAPFDGALRVGAESAATTDTFSWEMTNTANINRLIVVF